MLYCRLHGYLVVGRVGRFLVCFGEVSDLGDQLFGFQKFWEVGLFC